LIRVNNYRLLVDRVLICRRHLEIGGPVSKLAPKIAEHNEHKNSKQSSQTHQTTASDHPPKADTGGLHLAITAVSAICAGKTTAVCNSIRIALIG
jgi:hypothetical protein